MDHIDKTKIELGQDIDTNYYIKNVPQYDDD